jgi:hypothetical protein
MEVEDIISYPVLRLSVRQIITSENAARRSGYEGADRPFGRTGSEGWRRLLAGSH